MPRTSPAGAEQASTTDGFYRHGLRGMFARRTDESHRAATPLELLFDLTLVAAFGVAGEQLAQGIEHGHAGTAAIAFGFAVLSVVWAWINVVWFASAFDNDDWLYRVLTLVQMAGIIVFATGLPALFAALESGASLDIRLTALGYVVMRLALVAQWMRVVGADPRYRRLALIYGLFVGGAQVGWVLLAVLGVPVWIALIVAIVLLAVEVTGPLVAERAGDRRGGGGTPWHSHHLAERFGLLAIIALGETVVGTLASALTVEGDAGRTALVIGIGLALSFALWWTYFLVPHAPAIAARRKRTVLWAYGHVPLYAAIAAVGAGLHLIGPQLMEHADDGVGEIAPVTAVAAIAVPVLVFGVVRYLLQVWLVSARPRPDWLYVVSTVLPAGAIALAAVGVSIGVCLLVVLASPVSIIVAYELGAWRSLGAQLERVTEPAG